MKREVIKEAHWDRTVLHPIGILAFQIYYPLKEWKDGKLPVKDQLSNIISQLEIIGKEKKERTIQHRKDNDLRKEKERIANDFHLEKERFSGI